MIFINIDCPARCNTSFRNQTDKEHHKGVSILETIPNFDMVTGFVLDYMHLVLLGVVRKILNWLKSGPIVREPSVRLQHSKLLVVSDRLKHVSKFFPVEFARKPRSIFLLAFWKATEFRTFLLYSGPIVLLHIIRDDLHVHFLKLHVAMKILLHPDTCEKFNGFASGLLNEFVDDCPDLYGNEFMSYNVHGLIHLRNDAALHSHLDRVSAFPFEDFLGNLKKLLRKPNAKLKQVVHRYFEREKHGISEKPTEISLTPLFQSNHVHYDVPMLPNVRGTQYNEIFISGFKLTISQPNNYMILNDRKVVVIKNFVRTFENEDFVLGFFFQSQKTCIPFPFPIT